jgi:hypothetical protein
MTEVKDRVRPTKHRDPPALVAPKGGAGFIAESPYERARARLDALADPDALPTPPQEVLALKSTRALEDWEDLMLVQDAELWGAVDLTVAAQLVCLQELCRDMQFQVQSLGQMTEFDRWGTQHPSVHYRMWTQTVQQIIKLRASIGFNGTAREKSMADANRRARKAIKSGVDVIKKASEPAAPQEPPPPPPLAGSDLTA